MYVCNEPMISSTINLYRKSFEGLSPSVWFLSLINLVNRSGTMVVPFMSMYITQDLGLSLTKAGFVLTCFGLGAIIGSLIGGKLTDLLGYYKVQLFTLSIGGLAFIILGQMKDYPSICGMTFLVALINEAFRPANMAAIALYSTVDNRARSSSLVRLSVNLGWAIGATVGGMLASVNYKLLFYVDGVTNMLAAICLYLILKPKKSEIPKEELISDEAVSVYKDKTFLYFVVLSYFFALCFFQIFSTYPVFLKKELQLPEHKIGWLFALNGLLIALFEMIIVSTLSKKGTELKLIQLGLVFTGISFLVLDLSFVNSIIIGLSSCLLFTAGEIFAMPFMMSFWMNRTTDRNRGQYASLYAISYSAAHISGPFLGGLIVDHWGFSVLWIGVFCFCLLTAQGFKFLYLEKF